MLCNDRRSDDARIDPSRFKALQSNRVISTATRVCLRLLLLLRATNVLSFSRMIAEKGIWTTWWAVAVASDVQRR